MYLIIIFLGLKYHFIKFPPSEKELEIKELLSSASFVATLSSRMTTCFSYYHSFSMTENYLIMIEQPWVSKTIMYTVCILMSFTDLFLNIKYFLDCKQHETCYKQN